MSDVALKHKMSKLGKVVAYILIGLCTIYILLAFLNLIMLIQALFVIENIFELSAFLCYFTLAIMIGIEVGETAKEEDLFGRPELLTIIITFSFLTYYYLFLIKLTITMFYLVLLILLFHNLSNSYAFTTKLQTFVSFKREKIQPILFIIFIYITYNLYTLLFKTSNLYTSTNIFNIDFLLGSLGVAISYIQGLSKSIKDPLTGNLKVELLFWIAGFFALTSFYKFLPIINKILNIIVYSLVVILVTLHLRFGHSTNQ